jgi:hypothetical protein
VRFHAGRKQHEPRANRERPGLELGTTMEITCSKCRRPFSEHTAISKDTLNDVVTSWRCPSVAGLAVAMDTAFAESRGQMTTEEPSRPMAPRRHSKTRRTQRLKRKTLRPSGRRGSRR